jgi:hypothetical protein
MSRAEPLLAQGTHPLLPQELVSGAAHASNQQSVGMAEYPTNWTGIVDCTDDFIGVLRARRHIARREPAFLPGRLDAATTAFAMAASCEPQPTRTCEPTKDTFNAAPAS